MNYWYRRKSLTLLELHKPFIQMVRELSENGREARQSNVWLPWLGVAS